MRAFTNLGGVAGACALAGATRTAAMSVQRMAKAAAKDGAHPSGKKRAEHRKVTEGKARGRTPLAFFGWTMFSGRLVVCGAHGHGREGLES